MKDNNPLFPSEENELNKDIDNNIEEKKKNSTEKEEIPHYDVMQTKELLERLRIIIEEENPNQAIERVRAIEKNFFKKHKEKDDLIKEFKVLLEKFIAKHPSFHAISKKELEKNLKKKYEIIEKIKNLINSKQTLNELIDQFNKLKDKWKKIGPIPPHKKRSLEKEYQQHLNKFIEYKKITIELRKLNFKKNYQAKIKLCEITEELLESKSIIRAYAELHLLHRKWKEIGHVDQKVQKEIWQRFSKASSELKKRYNQHFSELRKEHNDNFNIKTEICNQIEKIANTNLSSHSELNKANEQVLNLQNQWKETGFIHKKNQSNLYKRYRKVCKLFFELKKNFYNEKKNELQQNLEKKLKLCDIAEKLQNNTDWKNTTEKFIQIQKKWKEIGAVPKRKSDKVWKRFRTACNYFFDEKNKYFRSPQESRKLKSEIIDTLVNYKFTNENDEEKLKIISNYLIQWNDASKSKEKNANTYQKQFDAILESWFSDINMNYFEREITLFKFKIDYFLQFKHAESKLISERNKLESKIQKLESNIITWQENIERFAVAVDNSILNDTRNKIEKTKIQINILRKKIDMIDELAD
jgi:hypothetical protein